MKYCVFCEHCREKYRVDAPGKRDAFTRRWTLSRSSRRPPCKIQWPRVLSTFSALDLGVLLGVVWLHYWWDCFTIIFILFVHSFPFYFAYLSLNADSNPRCCAFAQLQIQWRGYEKTWPPGYRPCIGARHLWQHVRMLRQWRRRSQ